MKNVNPKKAFGTSRKLSELLERKFLENDLDFYIRYEKFVDQENLCDQRFRIGDRYDLCLPDDYVIVTSTALYEQFVQQWVLSKRYGVEINFNAQEFDDRDFHSPHKLIPGKTYEVTEYIVGGHLGKITYSECIDFLKKEKLSFYGLPVLFALADLKYYGISRKASGTFSITPPSWHGQVNLFFASLLSGINFGNFYKPLSKDYISKGSTIVALREKEQ